MLSTPATVTVTHVVRQSNQETNNPPAIREVAMESLGEYQNIHYWALPQGGTINVQVGQLKQRIDIVPSVSRKFEKKP